jgi:hypothetical protein
MLQAMAYPVSRAYRWEKGVWADAKSAKITPEGRKRCTHRANDAKKRGTALSKAVKLATIRSIEAERPSIRAMSV